MLNLLWKCMAFAWKVDVTFLHKQSYGLWVCVCVRDRASQLSLKQRLECAYALCLVDLKTKWKKKKYEEKVHKTLPKKAHKIFISSELCSHLSSLPFIICCWIEQTPLDFYDTFLLFSFTSFFFERTNIVHRTFTHREMSPDFYLFHFGSWNVCISKTHGKVHSQKKKNRRKKNNCYPPYVTFTFQCIQRHVKCWKTTVLKLSFNLNMHDCFLALHFSMPVSHFLVNFLCGCALSLLS